MDDLVYFGDAVKALDDKGKVGGYLIRFGDATTKDLDGDYFDAKGYYGPKDGDGAECLFDHGYPVPADRYRKNLSQNEAKALVELSERTFQPIKTKRDAIGIFAETVLNLEDEYEKFIHSRVTKGKIGWSSGAPSHRVRRDKDGKITKWTIAEGSLTPRPAEPLNRVVPVKSLGSLKFTSLSDAETEENDTPSPTFKPTALASRLTKHIEDMSDGGKSEAEILASLADESGKDLVYVGAIISGSVSRPSDATLKAFARVLDVSFEVLREAAERDGAKTIKGMFESLADNPTPYQIYERYCEVVNKITMVKAAARQMGEAFDSDARVQEAVEVFGKYLHTFTTGQVNAHAEAGEELYLKAILNPDENLFATVSVDLEDNSRLVVSALKGLATRFRANHEARVKAGRAISKTNRERITSTIESIEGQLSDLRALLDESQPMATEEEKNAAQIEFLRLQRRVSRLGATTNGKETTGVVD